MEYVIDLFWDEEAEEWIGINHDIYLILESDSIGLLKDRIKIVVSEMLSRQSIPWDLLL